MIPGGKRKPKVIAVTVRKRERRQHHAGAWKLAYADFVTAMMAFFLLMWVTITFNKSQIQGIADYFSTPLTVRMSGGRDHGDRDAAIRGSGTDITRSQGQVSHGHAASRSVVTGGAHAHPRTANLAGLKGRLENSIAKNDRLSQFKSQISITQNNDSVLLQIIDDPHRPMFPTGSARLTPSALDMLQALGHVLNLVPNKVSIAGHTDARPYAGPKQDYSNWELSLDRANACRRALLAGGMTPDHIMRVVGLGAAVPLVPAHPGDAMNRRISITLLGDRAVQRIEAEPAGMKIHGSTASSH